jgi:hypothetical protein
MIFQFLVHM